jgi:hypothetical protein
MLQSQLWCWSYNYCIIVTAVEYFTKASTLMRIHISSFPHPQGLIYLFDNQLKLDWTSFHNAWFQISFNLSIVMTLWRYDVMTLWRYDVMTLWRYDVMTLWRYDVMTLWRYDVISKRNSFVCPRRIVTLMI